MSGSDLPLSREQCKVIIGNVPKITLVFRSEMDLGGASETAARTPLLQEQEEAGGLEEAGAEAGGLGQEEAGAVGPGAREATWAFWVERDAADIEIGDRLRLFK